MNSLLFQARHSRSSIHYSHTRIQVSTHIRHHRIPRRYRCHKHNNKRQRRHETRHRLQCTRKTRRRHARHRRNRRHLPSKRTQTTIPQRRQENPHGKPRTHLHPKTLRAKRKNPQNPKHPRQRHTQQTRTRLRQKTGKSLHNRREKPNPLTEPAFQDVSSLPRSALTTFQKTHVSFHVPYPSSLFSHKQPIPLRQNKSFASAIHQFTTLQRNNEGECFYDYAPLMH